MTAKQVELVRTLYVNNRAVGRVLPAYVAGLPEHVSQMLEHLSTRRLRDLRRLVHQLRGSGGAYGFPDITRLAAAAEESIEHEADPAQIEDRVRELVELLRRVEGYDGLKELPEGTGSPLSNFSIKS